MKARKKYDVTLWLVVPADSQEEADAVADTCVDTLIDRGEGFIDSAAAVRVEEQ